VIYSLLSWGHIENKKTLKKEEKFSSYNIEKDFDKLELILFVWLLLRKYDYMSV
jgi:hypothetical protein